MNKAELAKIYKSSPKINKWVGKIDKVIEPLKLLDVTKQLVVSQNLHSRLSVDITSLFINQDCLNLIPSQLEEYGEVLDRIEISRQNIKKEIGWLIISNVNTSIIAKQPISLVYDVGIHEKDFKENRKDILEHLGILGEDIIDAIITFHKTSIQEKENILYDIYADIVCLAVRLGINPEDCIPDAFKTLKKQARTNG